MWPFVLLVPLAAGIMWALVGGVANAAEKEKASAGGSKRVPPQSDRQAALRRGLVAAGVLHPTWHAFFEATAMRESNFYPRAHNDTPSEVAASKRIVYRENAQGLQPNVAKLKSIGQDPDAWVFGSKGLFQFLGPVVALRGAGFRFPSSAIEPNMAFDPGVAIAAAVDFAATLMTWDRWDGTLASLAVGWGNPSKMGDAAAVARSAEKLEKWGEKAGYPRGWASSKVPTPLPRRSPEQNLTAARAAAFAYRA